MSDTIGEVISVNIEEELKRSYLDYAMSVIVGRALPDVRDGLKPVHRRVLFAMNELRNDWNKPYKKSARIVGDVVGKYHPHGDSAVYDTLVRMAQPFSLRYMLVDGQGNFGSIDGDSAAAMRYTEVRMTKLTSALLADIDKETVDFVPNYDESEHVPAVLPTRVPNLLINGASGIAVGMATNIPPHNLGEVIDATIALIDTPELTIDDLMAHLPGPDFPTQGIINGKAGIIQAYRTGRGRIYVRARYHVEEDKQGKPSIIVTELPYQVNKAAQIEKIASLVKEKKVEGITALRDESDKDGMRIVIELRRGEMPEVLMNNLYTYTQLQSVFGMNMVALVDGQPKVLDLKHILNSFIQHRREVVTRRTLFELKKAKARAHLLEGLSIALANIDAVIQLIKQAKNPQEARQGLLDTLWQPGNVQSFIEKSGMALAGEEADNFGFQEGGYRLSPEQAQAILDLRLHKLTGLEQDKITEEFHGLLQWIGELAEILADEQRLLDVIKQELRDIKQEYNDARRTEIVHSQQDLTVEDLIAEEEIVLTISQLGYAKRQSLDFYKAQRRGGKGRMAAGTKEEDLVDRLLVTKTHDTLLCFSNKGKVYWMKAYQFPEAGPNAKGRPINNLLPLVEEEKINAILPVSDFSAEVSVVMATSLGTIKRVALSHFARPRSNGIIAIDLADNDLLVGVELAEESNDIMLFSNAGKAIRFRQADLRQMGRTARGVRGIKLKSQQYVVSLIVVKAERQLLIATENGYGKQTPLSEFRAIGRGGQGVIAIQTSERNGAVVGAIEVDQGDEIMLISSKGTLVRTRVDEISQVGRQAQGVRLMTVGEQETLVSVGHIPELNCEEDADEVEDA